MSTDRPDKTESPYTVDAGRFQIEMDLVTLTIDEAADFRVETVNVAPINIKLGLTYAVSDNIQLDADVNLGLTDAADDLNVFVGVSGRF